MAATAHPDDIEFMMAGTLLRLKKAGARIHMWNLANGSCGTVRLSKKAITRKRLAEARASARLAGARYHRPLGDDIALFYEPFLLARVAAVVRRIRPRILLVQSPDDYMEDHQMACRLLITGAFVRGMRNFRTRPRTPAWGGDVTIYHSLPHGLKDGLRRRVRPGSYVDIGGVMDQKKAMLSCHVSQREWLDKSQGMGSYVREMVTMSRAVGRMSRGFRYAEGWQRHSHLGFSAQDRDPLKEILGAACKVDARYENGLLSK